MVYDDEAIFIGAVCFDTPDSMSKILCQRDRFNANTDYFSVMLDTYNDQLNGFVFRFPPVEFNTMQKFILMRIHHNWI